MEMSGEYRIPASRQRVWDALNDPETLKQVIPGCETLEKVSEHELDAAVRARIGPVSARFGGRITLSELNPPESYRISGEGKGGAAGFAKGGAFVTLSPDGDGTMLRYTANAEVGGKLAQIGSRLVQGSAKKMADDFFGRFAELVAGAPAVGGSDAAGELATPTTMATMDGAALGGAVGAGSMSGIRVYEDPNQATAPTGGADAALPVGASALPGVGLGSDPIGAEFPGTVGAARPGTDPDAPLDPDMSAGAAAPALGAAASVNAAGALPAGLSAEAVRDTPIATAPYADPTERPLEPLNDLPGTGMASPMAAAERGWYARPVVWVVILAALALLLYLTVGGGDPVTPGTPVTPDTPGTPATPVTPAPPPT